MPELINYLLNVDFNDIKKDIEHYDEGKIWDIVYEVSYGMFIVV